ncbi:hypothetical protein NPIL_497521 [Nephila pilipes]|uniref:Uncharacterized protein n=1 Tax=Nephila pilipes TaxID=299642 RepID=A0A8X6TNW7_NEPPI|nr:hypothetical protein NPIL_166751 [Nephila pilipes]GFT30992.1 hypothetical protein NPIL_497521 [Nephila pilipes]
MLESSEFLIQATQNSSLISSSTDEQAGLWGKPNYKVLDIDSPQFYTSELLSSASWRKKNYEASAALYNFVDVMALSYCCYNGDDYPKLSIISHFSNTVIDDVLKLGWSSDSSD